MLLLKYGYNGGYFQTLSWKLVVQQISKTTLVSVKISKNSVVFLTLFNLSAVPNVSVIEYILTVSDIKEMTMLMTA